MMPSSVRPAPAAAFLEELVEVIWNQGRLDLVTRFVHRDYVQVDQRAEVAVRGPDGYVSSVEAMRALFGDVRMRVTHAVADGATFAYRWELCGQVRDVSTMKPAMQVLANDVPELLLVHVTGMNIGRLADGLLIEEVSEVDAQAVAEQMGWWP